MSGEGHESRRKSFEEQDSVRTQGFLGEFVHFLRYNRKWWLTPIILALVVLGVLVVLGGTAAAPFVYTLF